METTSNQTEPPWPELLGSNNWEGLLHPLNLSLRTLILRCGDFCQATYDAFNNDRNSPYCGSSRYGKKSFFEKVMLPSATGNYEICTFLYATAKVGHHEAFLLHSLSRERWDRESNWIGYIATTTEAGAASSGRREIYVAWRGTTRDYEWINVLGAKLKSAKPLLSQKTLLQRQGNSSDYSSDYSSSDSEKEEEDDEKVPKVMLGWLTIYTSQDPNSPFTKASARTQLLSKIKELVEKYKDEKVGNRAFNKKLKTFSNVKIMHIRNKIDLIPHYPSHFLGYVNSGTELHIDTRKSPSLKRSRNPSDWHNLQGMLHVVAGWNGEEEEFELKVERSLALVNKSSEFLKDECLIPGSWWVEKNRGMVLNDGMWILAPPAEEDLPVPEY